LNIRKLISALYELEDNGRCRFDVPDVLDELEVILHKIGEIDNFTPTTLFKWDDDMLGIGEVSEPFMRTEWDAIRSEIEGNGKIVR
tara:strand:- start:342 stop:599 length:258 start_codon:yes stop_codon:yes gene_type:complete